MRSFYRRNYCLLRAYRAGLGLIAVLLLLAVRPAAAAPVNLDTLPNALMLSHGELSWLRDSTGRLTARDVATSPDFQPLEGNLGKGYTTDVYWLKLSLRSERAPSDWWLDIQPPNLDDLQLFQLNPDGSVIRKHSGDRQPLSQHDVAYSGFLFHLLVPAGTTTVLLRVQTSSSMVVISHLRPAGVFPADVTARYLVIGIYLSVITTMLILSAVFVIIRPQPLYVLYLAYLLCQWLTGVSSSGMAAQFLFPQLPAVPDRMLGFSSGLGVLFGMRFFAQLLRVKEDMRWQWWLFQVSSVLGGLTAIATLAGFYVYIMPWLLVTLLATTAGGTLTLYRRLRYGGAQDRLFALAFYTYMVSIAVTALPLMGLLPVTRLSLVVSQLGNIVHLLTLQITIMLHIRDVEESTLLARRESHERQQIVAEQDQFLALITHEIRTPLTIIGAAADSLQIIDEDAEIPDRSRRYFRISQALTRVENLLDLIVQRDRIDDSGAPHQQVDIVALTRDVLSQAPGPLQERVRLSTAVESVCVSAQAGLLQYALFNLIDNAYKYAPPATPVFIDIQKTDNGQGLKWTITDQGPGVPPAERERVFEKHYRSAERTGVPGLGLGLYIADRLVRRHGGELTYQEIMDAGACFQIWLPLAPET